jgi:CheY-like chemotaxis protein
MELDPSGAKVKADPIRLEQIFRNLLNNAVKFTPSGGRITVQSKRSGKPGSESIQIRVSDSGRGIKAEFLPMLFTRFTQAETTTTRAYGGLGLGLSIVRHLVEMHGGTVIAESPGEEKGAVFTVELPCAKVDLMPDTVPGPEKSQEQMPQTPAKLDGVRVLIVDDMKDTRNAFREILQSLGADVRTAASAREGFDVFGEYKPDVLLCDLAMPEEDGYSLIRKIRTLRPDQGGKTPAAALTALADTETTRRTLDAQFDRHIPKPVDVVTLSNVIAKLAGK